MEAKAATLNGSYPELSTDSRMHNMHNTVYESIPITPHAACFITVLHYAAIFRVNLLISITAKAPINFYCVDLVDLNEKQTEASRAACGLGAT